MTAAHRGAAGWRVAIIAILLAAGLAAAAAPASADAGAARDLQLETSSLLRSLVNDRKPAAAAPSGAFGINAKFEDGTIKTWGIAQQRQGRNAVLHGLATKRPGFVSAGLRMFNWAFRRQAADGSFPRSLSALYQYASFTDAVSRSCLLIAQSRYAKRFRAACNGYRPRIALVASQMLSAPVQARGDRTNACCTHRLVLVGTAFAMMAHYLGNRDYARESRRYMRKAIALQRSTGVAPERGGHDSSYQMVSMELAARWLVYERDRPLYDAVGRFVRRGLSWERSRIGSDGDVRRSGNTRSNGQEVSPLDGRVKGVSYISIIRGFGYWGTRVDSARDRQIARAVAARHPRKRISDAVP